MLPKSILFLFKNIHIAQSVVQCSTRFIVRCIVNHLKHSLVLYLFTEVTGVFAYEQCPLRNIQVCYCITNIEPIVLKVCFLEIFVLLPYT
jgi:hypothetical protein